MSLERQILFWVRRAGGLRFALHVLGSAVAPFAAGIALGYLLDPAGAPPRDGRPQPPGGVADHSRGVSCRRPSLPRRRRADPGQSVDRLHAETPGLRHAPAGVSRSTKAMRCSNDTAADGRARSASTITLSAGTDPKICRRFRRAGRAMAAQCGTLARLRRRGVVNFFSLADRHAGRRLLYPRRLGQDDRRRSTAGCRSTIATPCARSRARSTPRSPASFAASRWSACSSACGTGSA